MPKEMILTKGRVTVVDDGDFDWLSEWKWSYTYNVRNIDFGYAVRRNSPNIKPRQLYMHRVIVGARPGEVVDHINGNRLDNRRSNLRICTQSENLANKQVHLAGESGFKWVYPNKKSGGWVVRMKIAGKMTHIGSFKDKVAAALAADDVALKLYGPHAKLNFPK